MPAIPGIRWSATSSATCSCRVADLAEQLKRLGAGARPDDPVALAESAAQIAGDGGQHGRLVVDGEDHRPAGASVGLVGVRGGGGGGHGLLP